MERDFQDRIDEYLLHRDQMSDEDKAQFLKEIEENPEKKEQYEFTKSVKDAFVSRGEKLKAMADFQKDMEAQECRAACACDAAPRPATQVEEKQSGHGNLWLWLSGIAAILAVGFFAIRPSFVGGGSDGNVRGSDDVFDKIMPADSLKSDSIAADTAIFIHK